MHRWWIIFGLLLCAPAAPSAAADSFPNGPLTIICPWSAGGGTDGLSRQMAVYLKRELGVGVNVVNRTGGQGVTGHSAGASAAPDGQTLTMMTAELNMLHWRGLTDITCDSFETLMMLNRVSAALFVRKEAPWENIQELEAEIRRRPGEMTCSGTAKGATWHLGFAGWLDTSGIDPTTVKWIPTRGANPSLRELVAGGLDMVCCSLQEADSLMKSGRVRSLGVMAPHRIPGFEDVPTFLEQGVPWSLGGWRALGVPKGTPPEVVEKLRVALRKIVAGDDFKEFMKARGFRIAIEERDTVRKSFAEMDTAMGKLLTDPKFAPLFADDFGPYIYPAVIGATMLLLFAGLLLLHDRRYRGVFEVTACVVLWLLLTPYLGFILCSGLLVFALLLALGNRLRVALPLTVVLVPLVYFIFAVQLSVKLPRGFLDW